LVHALVSKKGYGCTWTWETFQLCKIKVKEQGFYCYSSFHSHSSLDEFFIK
jgi:hypothetical protein